MLHSFALCYTGEEAKVGPWKIAALPHPFVRGACYGQVMAGDIATNVFLYRKSGERRVDMTRGPYAINLAASKELNPTNFPLMIVFARVQVLDRAAGIQRK